LSSSPAFCHGIVDFTAIFTSNPEEYAGVHRSQDALRDRMVTMDLDYFDYETEVAVTQARSGLDRSCVEMVVRIVRGLRARGGYTVDVVWKEGRLSSATIRAKYAGPCRLRAAVPRVIRWDNRDVPARQIDATTIEFPVAADGCYVVAPRP
jgi:MoxR-like ATPase